MELAILQANLTAVLPILSRLLASKKYAKAELGQITLIADGSHLNRYTSNFDTACHASVFARVDKPGAVAVPGRAFCDCVKLMAMERIDFWVERGDLVLIQPQCTRWVRATWINLFPTAPNGAWR